MNKSDIEITLSTADLLKLKKGDEEYDKASANLNGREYILRKIFLWKL